MVTLLIIVYLAFITLGLSNPLLGAAWPAMRLVLGQPEEALGPASMVVVLGTVIASLLSSRLVRSLGTARAVTGSVLLCALCLILVSFTRRYALLLLIMIPLGFGCGMIDVALNGFVALHYQAIHMNWLHCMFGLGATLGPIIMGGSLQTPAGWAGGFRMAAYVQLAVAAVLVLTLSVWRRAGPEAAADSAGRPASSLRSALRLPGITSAMAAMFCFVGFEMLLGVWAATYMADHKGFDPATASLFSSLYFAGITIGRFFTGLVALKMESRRIIRLSAAGSILAGILMALPLPRPFAPAALLLLGIANAPLFPAMVHLAPQRFGQDNSQAAIGLLMAAAFLGGAVAPPVTSLTVRLSSLAAIPWLVLALAVPSYWFSQRIDRAIGREKLTNL